MTMEASSDQTAKKQYGFVKLIAKSLPEVWTYQLFSSIILSIVSTIIGSFISITADSTGHALSTGNMAEIFLTWRTPVIIGLAVLLVFCYVMLEIMIQIYMSNDILNGRKVSVWQNIKKAFISLKRFLNPAGIGILAFVIIAVPLCGLGFSVSLTRSFYIPNFIFDVIEKNPLFLTGYYVLIVFMIVTAYFWIFSFHGVLLEGLTPKEAKKRSKELLGGNHVRFIIGMAISIGIVMLLRFGFSYAGNLVGDQIEKAFSDIPVGFSFDIWGPSGLFGRTPMERRLVDYHVISGIFVFIFQFGAWLLSLLCNSYILIRLTRFYHDFSGAKKKKWPPRPKEIRIWWRVLIIIAGFVFLVGAGLGIGILYPLIFERGSNVDIVAHRAGGDMASENSLEGLDAAIEHDCYGSEIDIQRTKDGYYIVNHDNTFSRIAGVNKAAQDMTLAEIKALKVRDTSGKDQTVSIPTLEEMLDVIKDKEILFIELKGKTADEQMADDVVKMIREKDMLDDVVLISLKAKLIDYVETTYPEFETGVLIFAGIGNVAKMNCDILIMEEEMSTDDTILNIHKAGKRAIVWTVNQAEFLWKFLDSDTDAVITDKVELAERVQEGLDTRTDLEIISDKLGRMEES